MSIAEKPESPPEASGMAARVGSLLSLVEAIRESHWERAAAFFFETPVRDVQQAVFEKLLRAMEYRSALSEEMSSAGRRSGLADASPRVPHVEPSDVESLQRENADLRSEVELLKSRLQQEYRAKCREIQRYDQLVTERESLRRLYDQRVKANEDLAAAVVAQRDQRLRMFESYRGVVVQVYDDRVVVVFEISDDLVEQTYVRSQFLDQRLPREGDQLAVHVLAAELPREVEDQTVENVSEDDAHVGVRQRKNTVKLPRSF